MGCVLGCMRTGKCLWACLSLRLRHGNLRKAGACTRQRGIMDVASLAMDLMSSASSRGRGKESGTTDLRLPRLTSGTTDIITMTRGTADIITMTRTTTDIITMTSGTADIMIMDSRVASRDICKR